VQKPFVKTITFNTNYINDFIICNSMFYYIDLNVFFDNSVHNINKVSDRLGDYIKDPTAKNIHDIRTSIRRLDASFMVCPKKIQTKKLTDYVSHNKRLFKVNSEIRDFDVILEKVSKEGQMDDSQFESFEKSIKQSRKRSLKKATSIAIDIRKLNVPHINIYSHGYDLDKIQKNLVKRYNKVVLKFATKIESNFPVVITDSNKLDELHEVRKDSKKLRYLFELLLKNINKNKDSIGKDNETDSNNYHSDLQIQSQIEKLKKIQDLLGNIHDYDMTIACLRDYGKRKFLSTEMNLALKRIQKYEELVHDYKSAILNSENNLIMPIKIC
jgi:CHAD domain-containing protein